MVSILGISGSLRKESFNAALLKTAVSVAPEGCKLEIAFINGIPLYDADLESDQGIPEIVTQLI